MAKMQSVLDRRCADHRQDHTHRQIGPDVHRATTGASGRSATGQSLTDEKPSVTGLEPPALESRAGSSVKSRTSLCAPRRRWRDGSRTNFSVTRSIDLLASVSEMITTSDGAMDLLDKVRIDIDVGLAEVPVLYTPLYERVNGPFPGGSVQIGGDVVFDANVVFLEKFEAGEIVFGSLAKAGVPTFVPISTYAAGSSGRRT